MTIDEIRHLTERAQQGDQDALARLVEWAEQEALAQELAAAPAGVRAAALAGVAALWKARRAKAGRSRGVAASNERRGQSVHEAIDKILDVVSLFDQEELDLAIDVRAQIAKRLGEFGLKRPPCTKTIIKEIRLRKASSGVLP